MVTSQNKLSTRKNPTTIPTFVSGRYADILGTSEDGRLLIDYGRFHETFEG